LKRTSSTTPTSFTLKWPLTATREVLLPGGSDHALRTLLYNLFTIGNRMEEVRRYLGSCIGISGPQFSLMMAVLELQGSSGVSVGKIAEYLHVAGTFVAAESAKLTRKDYLEKRSDARDRRVSLLRVRPVGMAAIDSLLPELRQINDTFFEVESQAGFEALCHAAGRLVEGSRRVLPLIRSAAVRSLPA
jgi:MarR family transcriptional regulator, organic hydroperoxide resistance regulator